MIHSALVSISIAIHNCLEKQNIFIEPSTIRKSLLQTGKIVNEQNQDQWHPRYLNKKIFRVPFKKEYHTYQIGVEKILDKKKQLTIEDEFIIGSKQHCYYVDATATNDEAENVGCKIEN